MGKKNSRVVQGGGSLTTVLCLDGGGVRGIIAATILDFLESQLQNLDGEEARIADYFDVIGGTSTGALMTAMLATPNEHGRPMFAARDIVNFYHRECPKIFHQSWWSRWRIPNLFKVLIGPKYDGKYLRRLLKERLGNKKLHDALTNLVIPAFDIKLNITTIFSTFELKKKPSLDVPLYDICVGTSAAPVYLPAHYFETQRSEGEGGGVREFNLVDGGIGTNNPTSEAIREVKKSINQKKTGGGGGRLLVLSLGTGRDKKKRTYGAKEVAKWCVLNWIRPTINGFFQANSQAVERAISSDPDIPKDNYLRIQDDTLEGDVASVDIATKENLKNLADAGKSLLEKPMSRVDSNSGMLIPITDEDGRTTSNRDALKKFAERLSEERRRRLKTTTIDHHHHHHRHRHRHHHCHVIIKRRRKEQQKGIFFI